MNTPKLSPLTHETQALLLGAGGGMGSLANTPLELGYHFENPPYAGLLGSPAISAAPSPSSARQVFFSYALLETSRPDLATFARFANRVETASIYMFVAFDQGGVRDFVPDCDLTLPVRKGRFDWFGWMADTTFCRFRVLRSALKYDWTPPAEVETYTYAAFQSLCELTPESGHALKQLFLRKRPQAIEKLIHQLDLYSQLMEGALELASEAEHAVSDDSAEEDTKRLEAVQVEILGHAGTPHSLREAAEVLGMTRQNLHKRIGTGSALGVMQGRELVVPSIQFVKEGDHMTIVSGLQNVLKLFRDAKTGDWSALQFLVEFDPGLGAVPMERLKAGDVNGVVQAARSFLGLDER